MAATKPTTAEPVTGITLATLARLLQIGIPKISANRRNARVKPRVFDPEIRTHERKRAARTIAKDGMAERHDVLSQPLDMHSSQFCGVRVSENLFISLAKTIRAIRSIIHPIETQPA